jgi:hypothetical protein
MKKRGKQPLEIETKNQLLKDDYSNVICQSKAMKFSRFNMATGKAREIQNRISQRIAVLCITKSAAIGKNDR